MSNLTPERLREIRERCEKATNGPWKWNLNCNAKHVELEGVTGMRETVMRPARWGMSGARLQFLSGGLMENCEAFAAPRLNREHHAHWCADINHPDAQFIAHARTDLPDLLSEVERLRAEVAALQTYRDVCNATIRDDEKEFDRLEALIQEHINDRNHYITEWEKALKQLGEVERLKKENEALRRNLKSALRLASKHSDCWTESDYDEATALQRCEALCKTIGVWREENL
jgi:hypothetical protein